MKRCENEHLQKCENLDCFLYFSSLHNHAYSKVIMQNYTNSANDTSFNDIANNENLCKHYFSRNTILEIRLHAQMLCRNNATSESPGCGRTAASIALISASSSSGHHTIWCSATHDLVCFAFDDRSAYYVSLPEPFRTSTRPIWNLCTLRNLWN